MVLLDYLELKNKMTFLELIRAEMSSGDPQSKEPLMNFYLKKSIDLCDFLGKILQKETKRTVQKEEA